MTNLACGLIDQGFSAHVYALADRPQIDDLAQQLERHNVPVTFMGLTSKRQVFRAARQLKRLLEVQQPKLVQSFMFHGNVVAQMAVRRLPKTTRPVLVGGLRVADPSACRLLLERRACKRMQGVIGVSESVAEFARQRLRVPATAVHVVPNGIEIQRFATAQTEEDKLVCVGRLHEQKGLDWMLPLLPGVLQAHPGMQLHLVGDGPQQSALEQQAASLGIGDRVKFLGWRRDADQHIASAKALLLPSRWEGMPNVVLEAMAAGRPVLATAVEGVNELLRDDDRQVVALGDEVAFQSRLSELCSNDDLRRELGAANRRRAESDFSLSAVMARYADVYRQLLRM